MSFPVTLDKCLLFYTWRFVSSSLSNHWRKSISDASLTVLSSLLSLFLIWTYLVILFVDHLCLSSEEFWFWCCMNKICNALRRWSNFALFWLFLFRNFSWRDNPRLIILAFLIWILIVCLLHQFVSVLFLPSHLSSIFNKSLIPIIISPRKLWEIVLIWRLKRFIISKIFLFPASFISFVLILH